MEFIYITNDPARALAAEAASVDQVLVDLEINGKVERQGGLDTVISRHTSEDITTLREVLRESQLVVRVNPLFEGTVTEVDDAIARGADRLMLPMFTTSNQVERFCALVDGRCPITLLLETSPALARLPEILTIKGFDTVHVGLNDLHIDFNLKFMFELLSGGVVEYAAGAVLGSGLKFGFGGVARLGEGRLPAALILSEHLRLNSSQVILSRDFGRVFDDPASPEEAVSRFELEVRKLRVHLEALRRATPGEIRENRKQLELTVRSIVTGLRT
jgi:hypothetical protein